MGVYIKGMEMPKSCDECRIMVFEDTNCVPELFCGCPIVFKAHPQGVGHRPDYCPLVEVPEQMKWIPVTERLPERNYNCLVADDGTIVYGYMNFIGEWMDCLGDKLKHVSHWMPLPQPPEDGES